MDEKERKSAQARRRARRLAFAALFFVLSVLGAVLSVWALGRTEYRWHGFVIEARLAPATTGQTRIRLAPLGEIQARTHAMPVALIASLESIEVDDIKKLVASNPQREALAQELERVGRSDVQNFFLRQIGWGALGGLAAPILLRRRRLRAFAASSLLGTLAVAAGLASAFSSFDGKAFNTPVYTGTLKATPWVIQFGKDAFTKITALSTKLRAVAENLNVLYGRINALPLGLEVGEGGETIRILHISDLHNNLAALNFVREVAAQFKVDFIVDTGDLTDFGSPPELLMVQSIGKLPYPYVFVLGNHDSQAVAEAMAKLPNVRILNGQEVTVREVTLLGIPNPASARAGVGSVDTTSAELVAGSNMLLSAWSALPAPPDIVALHDPEESRALWGRAPLILCGHEHRIYIDVENGPAGALVPGSGMKTVLCNAGTTGAAGLRYFEKEKGVPFSCAVVTLFRPTSTAPPMALAHPNSSVPLPSEPHGESSALNSASPNVPASSAPAASLPPASALVPTLAPVGGTPTSAALAAHWQLRAIDEIVLDGSLGIYSVSHHTYNTPTRSPLVPPVGMPLNPPIPNTLAPPPSAKPSNAGHGVQ